MGRSPLSLIPTLPLIAVTLLSTMRTLTGGLSRSVSTRQGVIGGISGRSILFLRNTVLTIGH